MEKKLKYRWSICSISWLSQVVANEWKIEQKREQKLWLNKKVCVSHTLFKCSSSSICIVFCVVVGASWNSYGTWFIAFIISKPWLVSCLEKNPSRTKKLYTQTHTFYRIDLGNYQWEKKCLLTPSPLTRTWKTCIWWNTMPEMMVCGKMHTIILSFGIDNYWRYGTFFSLAS